MWREKFATTEQTEQHLGALSCGCRRRTLSVEYPLCRPGISIRGAMTHKRQRKAVAAPGALASSSAAGLRPIPRMMGRASAVLCIWCACSTSARPVSRPVGVVAPADATKAGHRSVHIQDRAHRNLDRAYLRYR